MSSENQYVTKLKDLIFTDGKILRFDVSGETLKVRFRDYCDSELEIAFSGVSNIKGNEGLCFDITGHKLAGNMLELLDDENNCVFMVKFKDAQVSFLTTTEI